MKTNLITTDQQLANALREEGYEVRIVNHGWVEVLYGTFVKYDDGMFKVEISDDNREEWIGYDTFDELLNAIN